MQKIRKNATSASVIRIRRGVCGHRYSACDDSGRFLGNFDRLSEARRHWHWEIRHGLVRLVRELDKEPDMSALDAAQVAVEDVLKLFERR